MRLCSVEILTWCDPKYFVFARGLIGSIRYHENKNKIHLCLLDFDEDQINKVKEIYKNDSQIEYIIMSSLDQKNFSVIDNNAANPDVLISSRPTVEEITHLELIPRDSEFEF